MGNKTILGEAGKQEFYTKCSENSRSQIVFRTDIFPQNSRWVPPIYLLTGPVISKMYTVCKIFVYK